MYKQVGLHIEYSTNYQDLISKFMVKMITFYKQNDEKYNIGANDKRKTFRLEVQKELPESLSPEFWYFYKNRYYRCIVKDLSLEGVKVTLCFDDADGSIVMGSKEKGVLVIDKEIIACKCEVRFIRTFQPTQKILKVLSKFQEQNFKDRQAS